MSDIDAALRDRVARVFGEEVAPALEMDATTVEVLDVSGGVVRAAPARRLRGLPRLGLRRRDGDRRGVAKTGP